ncbi:MAG: Fis family transcriptional regulator [Pyrobaculum sp.]
MHLREALRLARELGAFTAAQAAYALGMPLAEARERLERFVYNGLLKAVDVAGVRFYYRDPVEAAEVILSSVDMAALPREERRRLANL